VKQKWLLLISVNVLVLAIIGGGLYFFLNRNNQQPTGNNMPSITAQPTSTPTSSPIEAEVNSKIPLGWLTYTSSKYGFEIYYPNTYSALDDKNSLYGWPNGIVLFYKGGQSYDLAIEHWNDVSEYETKYQNQLTNLTIKNVGGQYITLLNMNNDGEVNEIIQTFKILK